MLAHPVVNSSKIKVLYVIQIVLFNDILTVWIPSHRMYGDCDKASQIETQYYLEDCKKITSIMGAPIKGPL